MYLMRNVPFSTWMRALNSLVQDKGIDVNVNQLLDLDFKSAHAEGTPPEDFFDDTLRPVLEAMGYTLELHEVLDDADIEAMASSASRHGNLELEYLEMVSQFP